MSEKDVRLLLVKLSCAIRKLRTNASQPDLLLQATSQQVERLHARSISER